MIAIGLDYGTTNSLVSVYQEKMYKRDIAKSTKESSVYHNGTFIPAPKRLINDLKANDRNTISLYVKECVRNLFSSLKGKYEDIDYSDVHLSITVPDAFKDEQCVFLKETIASASVDFFSSAFDTKNIDVIPEPIAAALYYSYCTREQSQRCSYVVVSDMGGGTTDLAIVKIEGINDELRFEVVCTEHDAALGGYDIDTCVSHYMRSEYDLDGIPEEDLMIACRYLKERLSYVNEETVAILNGNDHSPYVKNGRSAEISLDRESLERLIRETVVKKSGKRFIDVFKDLLMKLEESFKTLLTGKGYGTSDFNDIFGKTIVLPVGGSSRIPLIQGIIKDVFKQASFFTLSTEDDSKSNDYSKFDSVCRGAAIYSAYNAGIIPNCRKIRIQNRTPHRIALKYAKNKLCTCVGKVMPDGEYENVFVPKTLDEDGQSFRLNKLELYQDGSGDAMDDDTELLKSIELPDVIYTNHRSINDIKIHVKICIVKGRVKRIVIVVPGGKEEGADEDYVREIEM